MAGKIKLMVRYLMNLGILQGFFIYIKLEFIGFKKIYFKKYNTSLYYRPSTSDVKVFREIFLFHSLELPLSDIHTIIDGGAHIGFSSLYFSKNFPEALIYSIEPDTENFNLLIKNTRHYPSIITCRGAIWGHDTHLKINNPTDQTWAFQVSECPEESENSVVGYSLSSLMEIYSLEKIDLLKLDVEGSERQIFYDNYDYWIRRTANILIELHDWSHKDCSRTVFSAISNYNFTSAVTHGMIWFKNRNLI
jgi:FkbM family methyltransferase